jgi:hypothetical protein
MSEPERKRLDHIQGITNSLVRLSPEQLRTLAGLCLELNDLSELTADRLQRKLHVSTSEAVGIARVLCSAKNTSIRDIAIAAEVCSEVETVRAQVTEKVYVVCTAPIQFTAPVRSTFATMIEMVAEASAEIVVVGYVFTAGASEFVKAVARARQRGVRVTIIGNRMLPSIPILQKLWALPQPPDIYSWDSDGPNRLASLHAKLLICDRTTALVTSANFSLHGLHENIEIGLKVQSPSVGRLSDFVRQLIDSKVVALVPWG